ncbi:MAG: Crp/Fnr family transcriptional regulator [Leptospira sp.]|jgi:CRP/FNR family transcriptional regulator, anaerobic regulatory protein|nr:Crp/Fnr family transcriptional regulator [Leptospira sp.]NCS95493.1 Crp/Fnr family transcriptional regulator [Leptospira sp.]
MNQFISKYLSISKLRKIPKGKLFLKQGQFSEEIALIKSGCFQLLYTYKGKEWTKGFSFEEDWLGSLRCILTKETNLYSIKALENSEVYAINYFELEKHSSSFSVQLDVLLPFVSRLYLVKEEREFDFLSLSAEDRYKKFLNYYGENAKRLNQNHIASYLGITNVALSRIHSRLFNLG